MVAPIVTTRAATTTTTRATTPAFDMNPFSTPTNVLDQSFLRLPPLPRRTGHFRQRYFDASTNSIPPPFVYYGKNGEEVDMNDPDCVNNKSMFFLNPLFYCSIGR